MRPGAFYAVFAALLAALRMSLCSAQGGGAPPTTAPQSTGTSEFDAGRAVRLRALHDSILEGEVPTYYTPAYRTHARQLQDFVTGEIRFVRRVLHVNVPLTLAVLDERQWPLVEHQLPYPIPSVTDDPPVALVAANWAAARGFLPTRNQVGAAVRNEATSHGLTWEQATAHAGDLLCGHELGHAVVDAYGIVPGTHWLNELLASYVLYAYLQAQSPDKLWLIDVVQAGNQLQRPQRYVTLEDFEAHYMAILQSDVDTNNYGWYQGQFLVLIAQIYRAKGMGFVEEVRVAFPPGEAARLALGNEETLRRLEKIYPGFAAWAQDLKARPRIPST